MMYRFPFEKLEVWHRAQDLLDLVYDLTDHFPREEKYEMVKQARRSVASVSANLAEGSTRISKKEQARFSEIAYSSLAETFSHLYAAQRRNYIKSEDIDALRPVVFEITNKINALRKSQLKRWREQNGGGPSYLAEPKLHYGEGEDLPPLVEMESPR